MQLKLPVVASANSAAPVIKYTKSEKIVALYTTKLPNREHLAHVLELTSSRRVIFA